MTPSAPTPKSRSKKPDARKTTAAGAKRTGASARGRGGREADCERRSGPVAGTAILRGATFRAKGLQYADVDGQAIYEGDIVLGAVAELRDTTPTADDEMIAHAVGITGQDVRWPDATVPFAIDPALPDPQRVTGATAHWEAHTRIRFVQRTPANAGQFPDFVTFVPGDGCSSTVGRKGGEQFVTLGPNCTMGNAIHEIGHTVGLWHEQSREDRDLFVTIDFTNIDPSMQHNFLQHISDGDDLGSYDYGSIMHYPPTAFAVDGSRPTVIARQPLPPGVVMGQRTGLSQGDIDAVHAMYPAPAATVKEVSKDPFVEMPGKPVFQDLPSPAHTTPFVLATPHQAHAATGQPDGLADQVRQLVGHVGMLQQSLTTVVANQNLLASQLGALIASGNRPAR
ncbi:M12 family metallopeptidase [Streptomyces sp. NPDC059766]|uniref:M12 family metallopeptidase n=1 Tax=Streptomyces sp. NPDC059766 TaxID=3346940 RepID=UPI003649E83E